MINLKDLTLVCNALDFKLLDYGCFPYNSFLFRCTEAPNTETEVPSDSNKHWIVPNVHSTFDSGPLKQSYGLNYVPFRDALVKARVSQGEMFRASG